MRIAGYYVNPGLLRRVSLTTYRKCGGGFAKTGRGKPCPVPAQCAGTVDGVTSAHGAGKPPRRYAAPLPRGEFTRKASTTPQPTSKPHSPLRRGAAAAAGWFPRAVRGHLIFDI
ncbi:MAG: hypothetical protein LBM98_00170 [Oscillospiraceae bacterium]|nr:hypothetical protein [Oscillospiraceae bacterium]